MKKVVIESINGYDYTLVDTNNNKYAKNIEFYSDYKPRVGDIIYIDESILDETNLYAFDEIYDTLKYELQDVIKVVHDDKIFYFQRRYG